MLFKGVLARARRAVCCWSRPPQAHAAVTPNSCRYSIDNLLPRHAGGDELDARRSSPTRAIPSPVDGRARARRCRPRPAPPASSCRPTSRSSATSSGCSSAGHNEIPVRRVDRDPRARTRRSACRSSGRSQVTATTTIDRRPRRRQPLPPARRRSQYTTPVIPELTWTAVGGDIVFSPGAVPGRSGPLPDRPAADRTARRSAALIINALIRRRADLLHGLPAGRDQRRVAVRLRRALARRRRRPTPFDTLRRAAEPRPA